MTNPLAVLRAVSARLIAAGNPVVTEIPVVLCTDCARKARYLMLVPWHDVETRSMGSEWAPYCAHHVNTDDGFEVRRIEELTR